MQPLTPRPHFRSGAFAGAFAGAFDACCGLAAGAFGLDGAALCSVLAKVDIGALLAGAALPLRMRHSVRSTHSFHFWMDLI